MRPVSRGVMTRRGALLLGAATVVGASSCGRRDAELHFAKLSGAVTVRDGADAAINLVFVASPRHPVFSGVQELVVGNAADPDAGDLVLAGDSVTVEPGDVIDGWRVGTIPLSVPAEAEHFAVTTISLTVEESEAPTSFDIGRWTVRRAPDDSGVAVRGDYPASIPKDGSFSLRCDLDPEAHGAVESVTSDAPGVRLENSAIRSGERGRWDVEASLRCDDSADLFGISPTLILAETGSTRREVALDPILVGYIDMGEDEVRRIASR